MSLSDKETCKNCKISGGAHYKDCPMIKSDTTLVNDEIGNTFIVKSILDEEKAELVKWLKDRITKKSDTGEYLVRATEKSVGRSVSQDFVNGRNQAIQSVIEYINKT